MRDPGIDEQLIDGRFTVLYCKVRRSDHRIHAIFYQCVGRTEDLIVIGAGRFLETNPLAVQIPFCFRHGLAGAFVFIVVQKTHFFDIRIGRKHQLQESADLNDIRRSGEISLWMLCGFDQTFPDRIRIYSKHDGNISPLGTGFHPIRCKRSDCNDTVHLCIKEILSDLIDQRAGPVGNLCIFFIIKPYSGLFSLYIQFALDALRHSAPKIIL